MFWAQIGIIYDCIDVRTVWATTGKFRSWSYRCSGRSKKKSVKFGWDLFLTQYLSKLTPFSMLYLTTWFTGFAGLFFSIYLVFFMLKRHIMTRWTSPLIFMSCFYCLLPLDTFPSSTTEAHQHVGRTAVFLSCMHHYFLSVGVVFRMNFNVKCCVIAKNGKTRCYCKTLSQQCKTFEHNKMIVAKHTSEKTKSILEVSFSACF